MVDFLRLEERARAVLDPSVYAYYAGGSGAETTLEDNPKAWQRIRLRPHALRDVTTIDTSVSVLGKRLPSPVCVAPLAFQGLARPEGEVASAAGARRAGSLYVLSTRSSRPVEEVAAAAGTWWFQVYVLRDRGLTRDLVTRAAAAGAQALVLTGDTPYLARRRKDRDPDLVPDAFFRATLGELADRAMAEQAPDVDLDDIGWLAGLTGLPVVVKGVLRADDARLCLEAGAAGVIVSNHGGRQLDGAVAAADALPAVAATVGQAAEVYVDGGIRRGVDVLRALALGARAVFVGRPVLWCLTVGGAEGVEDGLASLTDDFAHAMALAGVRAIPEISQDLVWPHPVERPTVRE